MEQLREDMRKLISIYKKIGKPRLDELLKYYANIRTLKEMIGSASLAVRPNGKKHSHQRRIKNHVLRKVKGILLDAIAEIRQADSFEVLLGIIQYRTKKVKGFGPLSIYDIALRIGAKKGLYPNRVYLHAGTEKGAKVMGVDTKSKSVSVDAFPLILRNLEPYELEDFLCFLWKYTYKQNKRHCMKEIANCLKS